MTTFASPSFRASHYLSARPTPPQHWYDLTLAYHRSRGGKFKKAVDLGCGPGQIATRLTETFPSVLGVDPGSKMVDAARAAVVEGGLAEGGKLSYKVGSGESLGDLVEEGSVDLVVAGQAAHWFDFNKIYSSLSPLLSARGTIAFWAYGEMTLPSHPHLQPLISTYQNGPDHLGPHWQQPGRSIVEGLLGAVPFPLPPTLASPTLDLLGHSPWALGSAEPASPPSVGQGWDAESFVRVKDGAEMGIEREWTWAQLEGYLTSSSAWHEYVRVHGEEKGGELNGRYLEGLREGVRKAGGEGEKVKVRWPGLVMLMGKN